MENKPKWKEIIALHFRAMKDLEHYVPGRLPCTIIRNIVEAVSPYLTIWLSAQFINELATLRRKEEMIRWIVLTLEIHAVCGIAKALLNGWNRSLDSRHNPMKNRMLIEKFLETDYANVDSREFRDLNAQIAQFENWQGKGINESLVCTDKILKSSLSILGALALTVSLFTKCVPEGSLTVLNSPLFVPILFGLMMLISWSGAKLIDMLEKRYTELADQATLGNRQFGFFCNMATDDGRRLDIRTYRQQNALRGIKDSAFVPGGAFDKLYKGPYGMIGGLGGALGAVFTGFAYVFACLKAWAGAFSIGSVTQYVSAVTSLSENISSLMQAVNSMRNNHRFLKITYELLDTPR